MIHKLPPRAEIATDEEVAAAVDADAPPEEDDAPPFVGLGFALELDVRPAQRSLRRIADEVERATAALPPKRKRRKRAR